MSSYMVAQQKNVEVPRIEITWFGLLTLNNAVFWKMCIVGALIASSETSFLAVKSSTA